MILSFHATPHALQPAVRVFESLMTPRAAYVRDAALCRVAVSRSLGNRVTIDFEVAGVRVTVPVRIAACDPVTGDGRFLCPFKPLAQAAATAPDTPGATVGVSCEVAGKPATIDNGGVVATLATERPENLQSPLPDYPEPAPGVTVDARALSRATAMAKELYALAPEGTTTPSRLGVDGRTARLHTQAGSLHLTLPLDVDDVVDPARSHLLPAAFVHGWAALPPPHRHGLARISSHQTADGLYTTVCAGGARALYQEPDPRAHRTQPAEPIRRDAAFTFSVSPRALKRMLHGFAVNDGSLALGFGPTTLTLSQEAGGDHRLHAQTPYFTTAPLHANVPRVHIRPAALLALIEPFGGCDAVRLQVSRNGYPLVIDDPRRDLPRAVAV